MCCNVLTFRSQVSGAESRNWKCLCSSREVWGSLVSPSCCPDRENMKLQILGAMATVVWVESNPPNASLQITGKRQEKYCTDLTWYLSSFSPSEVWPYSALGWHGIVHRAMCEDAPIHSLQSPVLCHIKAWGLTVVRDGKAALAAEPQPLAVWDYPLG